MSGSAMRTWAIVLLPALAAGCNCGGTKTNTSSGHLQVDEKQIDFGEVCRKSSAPGVVVTPASQALHLANTGKVLLYVDSLAVDPAEMAAQFVVDPAKVPASMTGGETVVVPIDFTPSASAKGTVNATVAIQPDGEDKISVALLGTASAKPVDPGLGLSCPGGFWGVDADTCVIKDGAAKPYLWFVQTVASDSNEMALTFSNAGCPPLEIKAIAVTTKSDPTLGVFELSDKTRTSLTVVNGAPAAIKIRFAPKSGAMPAEGVLTGTLTFTTNDPVNPTMSLELKGTGIQPLLQITPLMCRMETLAAPCPGLFTLKNNSDAPLTLKSVALKNGNALFKLSQAPVANAALAANAETTAKVDYVPGAVRGEDDLVVDWVSGKSTAHLTGGSPPVVGLDPPVDADFGEQDRYRAITIENTLTWAQQLPLTLKSLELVTADAFELAHDPADAVGCPDAPAANTKIAPGQSVKACVHFKAGAGSDTYLDSLKIKTDDPLRAELLITLRAYLTCSRPPVASITSPTTQPCPCHGADGGATLSCVAGACHVTGIASASIADGSIVLSGEASYDLTPDAAQQCTVKDAAAVTDWEWSLTQKPDGATSSLSVSGKGANPRTTLNFDLMGFHQVQLVVYDKDGMASPPVTFNVYVGL